MQIVIKGYFFMGKGYPDLDKAILSKEYMLGMRKLNIDNLMPLGIRRQRGLFGDPLHAVIEVGEKPNAPFFLQEEEFQKLTRAKALLASL